MSARDRFTRNIECPKCGQKGILHLSEDDHPYMRSPHREIDGVEGDFKATMPNANEERIECLKCNEVFFD